MALGSNGQPVRREVIEGIQDCLMGALAGLAAVVAATPFEVVRSKILAQPGGYHAIQGSPVGVVTQFTHFARLILKEGGPKAFFVGIVPRIAEAVPASALYWVAAQATRRALLRMDGQSADVGSGGDGGSRSQTGAEATTSSSRGGSPAAVPVERTLLADHAASSAAASWPGMGDAGGGGRERLPAGFAASPLMFGGGPPGASSSDADSSQSTAEGGGIALAAAAGAAALTMLSSTSSKASSPAAVASGSRASPPRTPQPQPRVSAGRKL